MPKIHLTSGLKWIDPKEFDLNKYASNFKSSTLEVNLEHLKELIDLHNDQLLAQDKINIKKEISSNYQM